MTVEEATAVIEKARKRSTYIDIDEPELAILDGRFMVEVLEAIVVNAGR